MKPRDWFGVGLRLLGVWMLLSCLEDIRMIGDIFLHYFSPKLSMSAYVSHAVVSGLVGMYLLGGAPLISSLAYPRRDADACESCGYDLTGNASGVCPECGAKIKSA